jgi:hypothetical protein
MVFEYVVIAILAFMVFLYGVYGVYEFGRFLFRDHSEAYRRLRRSKDEDNSYNDYEH